MTKAQKVIVLQVFKEEAEKLNEKYEGTTVDFSVSDLLIMSVSFTLVKEGKERKEFGTVIGLKNGKCPYSDDVLKAMTKERVAKEVKRWEKALKNCFFVNGWVLK